MLTTTAKGFPEFNQRLESKSFMPVVKHHNASVSLSAGKSILLQLKIGSIDGHSNLNLFFLTSSFLAWDLFWHVWHSDKQFGVLCGGWVGVGGVDCFNI